MSVKWEKVPLTPRTRYLGTKHPTKWTAGNEIAHPPCDQTARQAPLSGTVEIAMIRKPLLFEKIFVRSYTNKNKQEP